MAEQDATEPAHDAPATVRCDVTGQVLPVDETVVIQGYRVGAEGKQILLDRLAAGDRLPGQLERPSVLRRFLCIFLDGIIMGVVAMVIMMPVMILVAFQSGAIFGEPTQTMSVATALAGLLVTTISVLYYTLMHGHGGQTVGKMAGRIKVVRDDGQPITMRQAFWRAMIYAGVNYLPSVLGLVAVVSWMLAEILSNSASMAVMVFILINAIFALVDRDRQQALHDRWTGTRVVMID